MQFGFGLGCAFGGTGASVRYLRVHLPQIEDVDRPGNRRLSFCKYLFLADGGRNNSMHIYFFIVRLLLEKLDLTLIAKCKFELFASPDVPVETVEYFLFISASCRYLLLRLPLFLILFQQLISFGLRKLILS